MTSTDRLREARVLNAFDEREPDLAEQLFQEIYEADLEPDDFWPDLIESDDDDDIPMDFDPDENDSNDEPTVHPPLGSDNLDTDAFANEAGADDKTSPSHQGYKSKKIMPNNYKAHDIKSVVRESCKHLSQSQQNKLEHLLLKFPKLFDGVLKKYKGPKVYLEVDPDAKPHRV